MPLDLLTMCRSSGGPERPGGNSSRITWPSSEPFPSGWMPEWTQDCTDGEPGLPDAQEGRSWPRARPGWPSLTTTWPSHTPTVSLLGTEERPGACPPAPGLLHAESGSKAVFGTLSASLKLRECEALARILMSPGLNSLLTGTQ